MDRVSASCIVRQGEFDTHDGRLGSMEATDDVEFPEGALAPLALAGLPSLAECEATWWSE